MAKDPAFLFYPGDWLGGTIGMSFEEKGAYLELLLFQFNRNSFTEKQAILLLRDPALWNTLKEKFCCEKGFYYNQKLKDEKEKRQNFTESRRQSRIKSDEDNVRIYIVRDNVRLTYKIGSSVNPIRRYNELSNQVNPAIMNDLKGNRDITLIWYSDAVLRSEENFLHKMFKDKNLSGEWFSLNKSDLLFIYKKYPGTNLERTIKRTENENENEIEDENKEEKERPKTEKLIYPFVSDDFLQMWNQWKIYRKAQDKFTYKSVQSEQAALSQLATKSKGFEETAIGIIRESMANGWKGFFEIKNETKYGKKPTGGDVDLRTAFEKIDMLTAKNGNTRAKNAG